MKSLGPKGAGKFTSSNRFARLESHQEFNKKNVGFCFECAWFSVLIGKKRSFVCGLEISPSVSLNQSKFANAKITKIKNLYRTTLAA